MPSQSPAPGQPRELLINDEGNAELHYLNADAPSRNWSYRGPGRDLQLIGNHRVLRSQPNGYAELHLRSGGALSVEVKLEALPGPIETARRLPNGNTVVAGNAASSIFIWELDPKHQRISDRSLHLDGVEKVRMVRHTEEGTLLFCTETSGRSVIHEADWKDGIRTLFEVPSDVPADSMVKAVRISADVITVSSGYAASLLCIDTKSQRVLTQIGGKDARHSTPGARPLSPFFFSGYQMFANGEFLISNWQGHSSAKNDQGYQLLRYDAQGNLLWAFDQTAFPYLSSLNNVIALDGLDTSKLHDEPRGVLVPSE